MNTILACVLAAMFVLIGFGWWLSRDRRHKTYQEHQRAQASYEQDMLDHARRNGMAKFINNTHKRPELKSVRPLNAQDAAAQSRAAQMGSTNHDFMESAQNQLDMKVKSFMPVRKSELKTFAAQQPVEMKTVAPQHDIIDLYDWAQPSAGIQQLRDNEPVIGSGSIIGGGGAFDGGGSSGDWGQTAAPASESPSTSSSDSSSSSSSSSDSSSSSSSDSGGGSSSSGD